MTACKTEIQAHATVGAEDSTVDKAGTRRIVLKRAATGPELAHLLETAEREGFRAVQSGRTLILSPVAGGAS